MMHIWTERRDFIPIGERNMILTGWLIWDWLPWEIKELWKDEPENRLTLSGDEWYETTL